MMENSDFIKKYRWNLALPLLVLLLVMVFDGQLYGLFGEKNYVTMHLMFEIFIIVVSLSIAIQAWLIVPYILSNQRLYIGALFLALGLMETIHTLSYKGMPFFIEDSSSYSATWFYIIARLTQPIGLLGILMLKPKKILPNQRWIAYGLACLYAFFWIFLIYNSSHLLPDLVIDGVGTTELKNGMQYLAIVLQILLILYLLKNKNIHPIESDKVIMGSIYLILGDIMFTTYLSVYDFQNFMGHLFQLVSYYYFMKALYYSAVAEPFNLLVDAQLKLEESEKSLSYTVYHDELTGLPNSRFLKEQLEKDIELSEKKFAVLMVEIDRLKTISESLGNNFAQLMIQKVAKRLRKSLSSNVLIGKTSEGEFTIILQSINDKKDIVMICDQIHKTMKEQFQLQHYQLKVELNIGISIYPDNGYSIEELLKHAQITMRKAQKEIGRYLFYQPEMEYHLEERLLLEHDLHYALEKGELFLEYQPQVNVKTGVIDSVEALLRWKHPEKGLISPATFIPIAEDTGLIIPIGEWVLETACKQAKKWQDDGISSIGIAVNLSIRQFYQQNLIQIVEETLKKTKLSPNDLELEITESMTMDTKHAIKILHNLKKLGVKIAIDDFGTGYSSMSYLKDFPIDCLKIDRAFVNDIQSNDQDGALISMIISLAKHLKLKVIAEGVEEVDQFSFLAEQDCDYIQGYLFSKPIRSEELSAKFNDLQQQIFSYL